jgi:enolase-phosphatase E1
VQWIDEDVKATPLKSLQGLIWEAGYQNGELTGHLYPDAIQHLKAWKANGLDLYIYLDQFTRKNCFLVIRKLVT